MKKLFSALVAVTMALSCMTTIGVSAASYSDTNSFFCDFEDFAEVGFDGDLSAELTGAGFTADTTHVKAIQNDAVQGNYLSLTKGADLKISLPQAVTSGTVRFGFSYKHSAEATGYSLTAYALGSGSTFSASGSNASPKLFSISTGSASAPECRPYLSKGTGSYSQGKLWETTFENNKWYRIEFIFDVTKDRWTMSVDGEPCSKNGEVVWAPSEAGDTALCDLADLKTFCIYNDQSQAYKEGETVAEARAIDDIYLVVEDGDATFDVIGTDIDETNKKVKIVLDEDLKSGQTLSASDIEMKLCGTATSVAIDNVKYNNNVVTFTYTGTLAAGREYEISLADTVLSINDHTCGGTGFVNASVEETKVYLVPMQDFENVTSVTYTNDSDGTTVMGVTEPYAQEILQYSSASSPYDTYATATRTGIYNFGTNSETNSDTTAASGKALRPLNYQSYKFGYPIDTSMHSGVITYEFDAYYYRSGNSTAQDLNAYYVNDNGEETTIRVGTLKNENKWHHYKIDYDTATGNIAIYTDGTDGRGNTLKDNSKELTTFTGRFNLTSNNFASRPLAIDNYTCYKVATPFSVKNVRYVDNQGKANGSSTITPETIKINVTFTEPVNDATISDITLKQGSATVAPDDIDVSADGLIVELTVPMLLGGADYTLTIPTSVKAAGGNTLTEEIVYSFNTIDGKFEVSGLRATGELNGGTTAGSTLNVSADVINTEGGAKELILIYAYYNDNVLSDVNYQPFAMEVDDYFLAATHGFTIDAGIQYDEVKVFVWDGIKSAVPLIPSVSYPQE